MRVNTRIWILRRDGGPPPSERRLGGEHTGERNLVMVVVVDRRGRWSRFDRINLAYSAAWRVVTGSNDIF